VLTTILEIEDVVMADGRGRRGAIHYPFGRQPVLFQSKATQDRLKRWLKSIIMTALGILSYSEPYTMSLPCKTLCSCYLIPIIISQTVNRTYMILIAVELSVAFWAKKMLIFTYPIS
jgi:hypothetical protein